MGHNAASPQAMKILREYLEKREEMSDTLLYPGLFAQGYKSQFLTTGLQTLAT